MTVTASLYTGGVEGFLLKDYSWTGDNFKALLLYNTYTYNQDSHLYVSDVTTGSTEVTGGSYARVALSGKSESRASGVVTLSASDITFAAMTATNVQYMVIFQDTGTDSTSRVIGCVNNGTTFAPSTQAVTFNLSTSGLITYTAS